MSKFTTGLGVAAVSLAAAFGLAFAQTTTEQQQPSSGSSTDPSAQQPAPGSTTSPQSTMPASPGTTTPGSTESPSSSGTMQGSGTTTESGAAPSSDMPAGATRAPRSDRN